MKISLYGGPGDGLDLEVGAEATAYSYPFKCPGGPMELHMYRRVMKSAPGLHYSMWEHSKGCTECQIKNPT